MKKEGIIVIGGVAAFFALVWVIGKSGNTQCARFETREAVMIHESKFGGRAQTYRYKVCAE